MLACIVVGNWKQTNRVANTRNVGSSLEFKVKHQEDCQR